MKSFSHPLISTITSIAKANSKSRKSNRKADWASLPLGYRCSSICRNWWKNKSMENSFTVIYMFTYSNQLQMSTKKDSWWGNLWLSAKELWQNIKLVSKNKK
jgi:hypothetical protein